MLTEHQLHLLTAAVDGELTPNERQAVACLLRESPEAVHVFQQLQLTAQQLQRMPKHRPNRDLGSVIVSIIHEQGLTPIPLPVQRTPFANRQSTYSRRWMVSAIAASLFALVGLSSFFFFAGRVDDQNRPVKGVQVKTHGGESPRSRQQPATIHQPSQLFVDQAVVEQHEPEIAPIPREHRESTIVVKDRLPEPRVVLDPSDVVATPTPNGSEPLQIVKVRLPLILPLRDLDQPYPREKLAEELKKNEVIRIDLFCRDIFLAPDAVQHALRLRGQKVIVDAFLADRLKKKQSTEVLLFTEQLSLEEIAKLLETLATEDRKLEQKKAGEGIFDKFVMMPYLSSDLERLARLLAVPPQQLRMPKPSIPGKIDLRKPLENNTANALVQGLPKASGARSGDVPALFVAYGPFNPNPTASKEIKSFMDKRSDRRQGVPLILVLRTLT